MRYWTPEEFDEVKQIGAEIGFAHVEAGPFVRSSYHAGEQARAAGALAARPAFVALSGQGDHA